MSILPLQALKDEKAPAIGLLAIVIAKYGTDCFDWEPESLKTQLEEDYDIEITDLQSDKIQAAITVLTSGAYEDQYEVFETCSHLLNNQPDTFEDVNPLEAEELITALAHAKLIVEGLEDRLRFSDEVNAYAGLIFYDYGFCTAPDLFQSAIIPNANSCDMTEKNGALQDLFNEKTRVLIEYMSQLSLK
jgi:hypothetical protein